jgi:uncharacterized tellurite resistance protein B-like protein
MEVLVNDVRLAMLQSLVAVAWADDKLHAKESEVIEALISAFALPDEEAEAIRQFAQTPRTLADVPLTELSAHDRKLLLQHAVLLSYVDGEPDDAELRLIDELCARLRIAATDAAPLLAAAHARARRLTPLLEKQA